MADAGGSGAPITPLVVVAGDGAGCRQPVKTDTDRSPGLRTLPVYEFHMLGLWLVHKSHDSHVDLGDGGEKKKRGWTDLRAIWELKRVVLSHGLGVGSSLN